MQLPTWLGNVNITGELTLSTDNKEALHVKAENKRINLDALDKEFVKKVLGSIQGGKSGGNSIRRNLNQIKSIAEELRDDGLTVTVSYKGKRVVTVGADAKPKISRIVTGTNAIEINSLRKLIEFGV